MIRKTFIPIILTIAFYSCKKDKVQQQNPATTDSKTVYISGYVLNSAGRTDVRYWKNGVATVLGDSGTATGLTISGNDIFLTSTRDSIANVIGAAYWRNGQKFIIQDWGRTTGIAISGTDVYVSGFKNNNGAIYWKNGQKVTLNTNGGFASGITVTGNDVYVVGAIWNGVNRYIPTYWKNNLSTFLTNGTKDAAANAIALLGNDVYTVGHITAGVGTMACYWKNGQQFSLNDTTSFHLASATSIAISNSDVYIAGYIDNKAVYWKNGQKIELSGNSASGDAIAISGTDVYIAGRENLNIVYWKNGQLNTVVTATTQTAVTGIAVQ